MGCDGVLGSDKRIDNCGRCGATEGVCLHAPCNIKKVDKQENGLFILKVVAIIKLNECLFWIIEYHVKLPPGSSHIKLALESSTCDFLGDETNSCTQ